MSRVSDRNLLFGMLALQMDFISRDALVEGMQAWMMNKSKSLGELLVERGMLAAEDHGLLDPLVEAHIRKHGGAEQSLAVLSSDEGIATDLKDIDDTDIRASLDSLVWPSRFIGNKLADSDDTIVPPEQPQMRFRILRPHAEGGLGKVSVAWDQELHREVAFKEIKLQYALEKNSRARFVVEAEVTGGLEHPGIVPVYGLGSYADGRPFYAMRFIKGDSLQQATEAFHKSPPASSYDQDLAFRNLIKRLIDVCNAMAYAHSRKVLHRDLKPGNIMLGKYGETLVVDWGLAKTQGMMEASVHKAEGEQPVVPLTGSQSAPTIAGSLLGTAAYMSPEQAEGKIDLLGPACDIYSLGATLYHVLSGQAPLKGVKLVDLLKRVIAGDIPSAKSINARVPAALNAICRKAMSTKIEDRYASATDVAKDLEAWLADKPVTAFVEPWWVRARRWSRKHPAVVSSVTAAAIMAAVGLSIGFIVVNGKNAELDAKNSELSNSLSREELARQEAQTNEQLAQRNASAASQQSELALSTLTTVIFDIDASLRNLAGGTEVRNRLLVSVLPQLDKVSTQFANKSAVDHNTLTALFVLADTTLKLGQSNSAVSEVVGSETLSAVRTAERLYQRAHVIAQELADAEPENVNAQRTLSVSFNKLGSLFLRMGRNDEALSRFQDGLKIAQTLAAADPNDSAAQSDLWVSHNKLGDACLSLDRPDEALKHFNDGLNVAHAMTEAAPNDPLAKRNLSVSFNRVGEELRMLGRVNEALARFEDGMKIALVLTEADPNNDEMQRDLAVSYEKLGLVSVALDQNEEALGYFEKEWEIAKRQLMHDPSDVEAKRFAAVVHNKLGEVLLTLGRNDDALTQFQSGMEIAKELATAEPDDFSSQRDWMVSHYKVGSANLAAENFEAAEESFAQGIAVLDAMIAKGQSVNACEEEKAILEERRQFCIRAQETSND